MHLCLFRAHAASKNALLDDPGVKALGFALLWGILRAGLELVLQRIAIGPKLNKTCTPERVVEASATVLDVSNAEQHSFGPDARCHLAGCTRLQRVRRVDGGRIP